MLHIDFVIIFVSAICPIPECFGSLQLEQFFCPQGLEVLQPGSGH